MTGADVPLSCQLGECRNRAALTVTLELPTSWTESREYTTRTLLVAVCGDCAAVLEADAKALLEARVRYAARLDIAGTATRLYAQLVALIEAVGPPYEPVQGGVFARWLADLDRPTAQNAWRRLADVKRRALVRGRPEETPSLRRPALVPSPEPAPAGPPRPPVNPSPRGGDDAA